MDHREIMLLVLLTVGSPTAAAPIVFGVVGDYGTTSNPATPTGHVANLIDGWNPDFVITVGDNNYGDLAVGSAVWDANIGTHYGQYILGRADYRYPNQTSATQRFFPSIGNHDTGTSANGADGGTAAGYLDYFNVNPGGADRLPAGVHTDANTYYDFVRGDVHFFALDADHALTDQTSRLNQRAWLEQGLADSTSTWNFVYFHQPSFTSTARGGETEMLWPFKEWGADAVFSGHEHFFERVVVGGLPYMISGAGGRSLNAFLATPTVGSEARYNADYGALRVGVDGTTATFDFYSINGGDGTNGGALVNHYTIDKTQTPPVTVRFEQGFRGYAGTVDTFLQQASPNANNSAAAQLNVDAADAGGAVQALLRFDDLFGVGPGRVPIGADIAAATLVLSVSNEGDPVTVHRMLIDWSDTATWNSLGTGVSADGVEAVTAGAATDYVNIAALAIDVTDDVTTWQQDPAGNRGWVMLPTGGNGIDFDSADGRLFPQLLVTLSPNTLDGDINYDGSVDYGDLALLAPYFGATGPVNWLNGDFNNDRAVDMADLDLMAATFGTTPTNGPTGVTAEQLAAALGQFQVPEPTSAAVWLGITSGLVSGRLARRFRAG
jgi:Calcineurin-like phosphoesterase/Dockerin type I domain